MCELRLYWSLSTDPSARISPICVRLVSSHSLSLAESLDWRATFQVAALLRDVESNGDTVTSFNRILATISEGRGGKRGSSGCDALSRVVRRFVFTSSSVGK
jgi:hypothetical protein